MTGVQTCALPICPIDAAEENAYFYKCPGKSDQVYSTYGGAMYMAPAKPEDGAQLLGIHSGAQNDEKNSWWAMRMSDAHVQTVLAWANGGAVEDPPVDGGDEEEETETTETDKPDCTCEETDTTDAGGGGDEAEEEEGGGDIADQPKP